MRKNRILMALVWTAILLFAFSLAAAAAAAGHTPLEDPLPEPIPRGDVTIRLETVADGMTAPNWGISPSQSCSGGHERLAVVDQDGILWLVNLRTGEKRVYLDVSSRLVALGVAGPGTFDERGFLGVAFHPDFHKNGLLYTYTSEPVAGPADFSTMPAGTTANHQAVIIEWRAPHPCDPHGVVDPASAREILRVDEPQFNHNAGTVSFGPDDLLYIALGDGGAADDQGIGHGDTGNGQNPGNVLGTILRIDPQGSSAANGQYGIPADNPFVGMAGFVPEIYAYGLRNPFRFSFDMRTGAMLLTDVGQNDIEEINIGMAGANYGWNIREGSFCFDPNGAGRGFVFSCPAVPGLVDPIAEYDHDEGLAIVGGFVYRGSENRVLRGRYIFGDWNQNFFANNGRLFYLDEHHQIKEFNILGQEDLGLSLLGFGQDSRGEVYVLANATGVPSGQTGVVLRMVSVRLAPAQYRAELNGAGEVPPVSTAATGEAKFIAAPDAASIKYKVKVRDIANVVASHIHCAPAGVNGPVGVTLFAGGPVSIASGTLAEGTITAPNPGNACGWSSVQDILLAMAAGDAYVNVHTTANPPGEIRGQVALHSGN